MWVMSALCHLRKRSMFWFASHVVCPVSRWLWRRLSLLWRYCFTLLRERLPRSVPRSLLPWRDDVGNEGNHQQVTSSPEDVEGSPGHKQRETNADSWTPSREEDLDGFDGEEYRVETADELYCGYDSTWEAEQSPDLSRRPAGHRHYKFSRFENAARDMQNYRHKYPNQNRMQHWRNEAQVEKPNLSFYLGQTPSLPDGVYISDFHKEWAGKYDTLEYVHTYIQWLFPLPEPGMNHKASTLTKQEIEDFLESRTAKENLLKSYKLMLDFYGIELADERTGTVMKAHNWRERFDNLDSHTHNNLRITRILKCLGTLGYPHYQAPLVHFFLEQTLVNQELPNVRDSVLNYFVFAVLDKRARRKLIKFAYLNYHPKEEFVWCPKKIQMLWHKPESKQQTKYRKSVHDYSPSVKFYGSDTSWDERQSRHDDDVADI